MNKLIPFLKKNALTLIGALAGAVGGYAYYYFIGCNSGSCAITSSPVNSTIYGILMGGLLFSVIQSERAKKSENGNK